jgi:hypothetical protein
VNQHWLEEKRRRCGLENGRGMIHFEESSEKQREKRTGQGIGRPVIIGLMILNRETTASQPVTHTEREREGKNLLFKAPFIKTIQTKAGRRIWNLSKFCVRKRKKEEQKERRRYNWRPIHKKE